MTVGCFGAAAACTFTHDTLILIFWALIYIMQEISVCWWYSLLQTAAREGGNVQEYFHSYGKKLLQRNLLREKLGYTKGAYIAHDLVDCRSVVLWRKPQSYDSHSLKALSGNCNLWLSSPRSVAVICPAGRRAWVNTSWVAGKPASLRHSQRE